MLLYNTLTNKTKTINTFSFPNETEILWFDLSSNHDKQEIVNQLNIHQLAKQNLLQFSDIPKVNVYQHEAVISLSAITDKYETLRVNILVGSNYVLTIVDQNLQSIFESLTDYFKEDPQRMADTGHILFHIINKISSSFLSVIDGIADKILLLEKSVFKDPFENQIGKTAYRWKAKLHELRQIIEPQEAVIKKIGRKDFPYINEDSSFYFQDLESDHARIVSAFDTFKENLLSIYNLQMSLKADHTNAVMKILTLVSVIFIPMTFLAGLYGMNFEHMPELKWRFGYGAALSIMFGIGISVAMYFRIKGWWGKNEQK